MHYFLLDVRIPAGISVSAGAQAERALDEVTAPTKQASLSFVLAFPSLSDINSSVLRLLRLH